MFAGCFLLVRVATPLPFFITRLKFQPQTQERVATGLFSQTPVQRSRPFFHYCMAFTHIKRKTRCRTCTYGQASAGKRVSFRRFFGEYDSRELRKTRMEQHTRVELASSVWKTDVLPLHQCCGMLPVLHGCGSVLDRNPEPGFPTRSAKASKTFGERLRLHGRTLFLRKKRYTMLLRAMPKRTAWGWDSELDRSDGVIKPQSAPAPIVYRANARTSETLIPLRDRRILDQRQE